MTALARTSDPATSHQAAASVNLIGHRAIVYSLLREVGPATNERLEQIATFRQLPISVSSLRSRRKELERDGLVRDTGRTEKVRSGHQATVWEVAS